MAVRISPTVYDPTIESDGLTLDTPLGPVDLVAVQRVLDGHPVEALTEAEMTEVLRRLGPVPAGTDFGYADDWDARARVRESLDITPPALSNRVVYRRRRDENTSAGKAA